MKKLITLVLSVVFIFTMFIGCGNSNKDAKDSNMNSLERVKKSGKLTMGLDDSYPPMEFRDSQNNLVGFDIDLGKEIAKKLGVKPEFTITDFNGIILSLKSSKFDMILSTLSMTEKRQKEVLFTEPYIVGGQIIAVKKGNTSITKAEDLKGKLVGYQLGSTSENAARKIEGIKNLKSYDKVTEAFHDLSLGRIEAIIVDGQVGGYYMKKDGGDYTILKEKLTKEPVGIGFKKEDKELRDAVQKAIDELKKEGTLSKLSIKWFGYDIYKE
ncbi:cystine-binding periplasmic protein precursor [Clostridium acetireducens DSM 10703]|jgi:polar amino acid transport system substrate-binding protein|uniref:Cystine-binding periplasmic protein n=1 Tax=Clostridium acetireducens DSM 10703 TaxID=1121290 RepID=A0A1E8EWC5_9CLOT|nr:ABC transporter substrate-binding protein [Clostridium acetireducens]OFI01565.1 cystine-binding periplasmic protein precursor [Clostridium acetireducens DSM 10703]